MKRASSVVAARSGDGPRQQHGVLPLHGAARIAWFESLVPRADAWGEISIVIVNACCNFRRPINYPGNVEVKVFAGAPGNSSVQTFYELNIEEELYADGDATVVFLGRDQKPLRIPDRIRALMQ
jgi:acyl-CoA thioester hydrolase